MFHRSKFDKKYDEFMRDLPKSSPDGVIDVNLSLLKEFDLLWDEEDSEEEAFPFQFQVVETPDKVTLFNEQFVVWITPKTINNQPMTFVLISLIHQDDLHLEIAFSARGIYNTPPCVLKVLRHFIFEVIDTEEAIASIGKS